MARHKFKNAVIKPLGRFPIEGVTDLRDSVQLTLWEMGTKQAL
jgi:hypothetical protein